MARANKQSTKRERHAELGKYEIKNAHEFDNGDVRFNLVLLDYGITLYGMRVVAYEKGDFISFPQRAVKDDNGETKYYNHYYIALSDEQQKEMIEAVDNALND